MAADNTALKARVLQLEVRCIKSSLLEMHQILRWSTRSCSRHLWPLKCAMPLAGWT
jgi:hypothetical protein